MKRSEQELKQAFEYEARRYYALWQQCNALYEKWSKRRGFSYNEVLTFYSLLDEEAGCTQKMISNRWAIAKQTVNMILKKYERLGYVELYTNGEDKRSKWIRLTSEGKRIAQPIISDLYRTELYISEKMGIEKTIRMGDDLEEFTALFREINEDQ